MWIATRAEAVRQMSIGSGTDVRVVVTDLHGKVAETTLSVPAATAGKDMTYDAVRAAWRKSKTGRTMDVRVKDVSTEQYITDYTQTFQVLQDKGFSLKLTQRQHFEADTLLECGGRMVTISAVDTSSGKLTISDGSKDLVYDFDAKELAPLYTAYTHGKAGSDALEDMLTREHKSMAGIDCFVTDDMAFWA
eukprot:TRINITY_DN15142_c0_g2_i1.p3 TRINITY_DN15142_c0_g2~~TRINITY_DN15142_c0_g2_i1.p3  ORF type:complete len:191 (+),score=52.24 TRINITY_DN15142_c0_g2_i1:682-1254(+)